MPSKRWVPQGRRDSGAVAVETAACSLLLIILLAGIVEVSYLFKDWIGVSSAARAGARMGASEPRNATFALDSASQVVNAMSDMDPARIEEVWVYKTTSVTGLPDSGSFASCNACVKFVWSAGTQSLVQISGNWPSTSQNACAGDPARDSLGVYVKYGHIPPLRFFYSGRTLTESTVMWIEPITSTSICKP